MKVTVDASDPGRLEAAADALARAGELEHAVALWALVLRFRAELGTAASIEPQANVIPLRRREAP